jgi:hypothetical protein
MEVQLGRGLSALAAARDTLEADRASLVVQVGELDAQRAAQAGAAAGETDTAARRVLTNAVAAGGDPRLYAEIIRSSLQIESALERRLVLSRLLEQPDLSTANVVDIIGATRTMGSDRERRIVLAQAVEHRAYPRAVPAALVESLRGFDSALEQRIVISALMEHRQLDTRSLAAVLRVVPEMRSDLERRIVLTAVAHGQRVNGAARDAYLAAARSIGSESERATALNALLENAGTGTARSLPPVSSAGGAAPAPGSGSAGREPRSGEAVWNSEHEVDVTTNGRRSVVRVLAKDAIIQGDRWNVRGFRRGGSLLVEEREAGRTRRVEAVCDGAGNPVWSYTVDRERRPFDASARAWMEAVIRKSSSS